MGEPRWRQVGTEPDYRFSLANERTFLAWIRTALGLLASGIIINQFSPILGPRIATVVLAAALGTTAAFFSDSAYFKWRANEIAIRHGRKLPGTKVISPSAFGFLLVALVITVLMVF